MNENAHSILNHWFSLVFVNNVIQDNWTLKNSHFQHSFQHLLIPNSNHSNNNQVVLKPAIATSLAVKKYLCIMYLFLMSILNQNYLYQRTEKHAYRVLYFLLCSFEQMTGVDKFYEQSVVIESIWLHHHLSNPMWWTKIHQAFTVIKCTMG